jgi:hypothetical protein
MKAGDTCRIAQPGTSSDSHLWVVISDPAIDPQRVLIVNFTTRRKDSDPACIFQRGRAPVRASRDVCQLRGGKGRVGRCHRHPWSACDRSQAD